MKNIYGFVQDKSGVVLPGVIVTSKLNPNAANTVTDTNGNFSLSVPDNETELNFYTSFLESNNPFDTYTIPTPIPTVWNIKLNLSGPVITGEKNDESKKLKLWPVYAGIGLLALLLLTRKKKRKK